MKQTMVLVFLALIAMVSACSFLRGAPPSGHVLVVDEYGAPIRGAKLLPDEDSRPGRVEEDDDAPVTDAQGMVAVDLERYLWESDSCYHFQVRCTGYVSVTLAVSKELLPALLKIEMKGRNSVPSGAPAPKSAPNAGPPVAVAWDPMPRIVDILVASLPGSPVVSVLSVRGTRATGILWGRGNVLASAASIQSIAGWC